jgi:hypothetical protein
MVLLTYSVSILWVISRVLVYYIRCIRVILELSMTIYGRELVVLHTVPFIFDDFWCMLGGSSVEV